MGRPASGSGPRRARAIRLARAGVALLLLAAAGVLARAWMRGDRILERLENEADKERATLAADLRNRHALALYASFDEQFPRNLVADRALDMANAVRVPGLIGSARRFDGRGGFFATFSRWSRVAGEGLSISLFARFPQNAGDGERRLLWDHTGDNALGLRLRDGALEAVFTDANGRHIVSAPAPAPGRFAHIAFSIGHGRAALFTDGVERASCPVALPLAFPLHLAALGTDGHFPAAFDVDEWCLWRRPLDAAEVARLAAGRKSVPDLLEPKDAARVRRAEAKVSAFRAILSVMRSLDAALQRSPAVLDRSVPALELRLSHGDRRRLRAAHLDSVESGLRTRPAAHARLAQATFAGRSERVAVWLDEAVFDETLSPRPALVLAAEGGIFGDGSGVVRLYPPEQYGARNPDAARPLPLDPSFFVRLHLDGDFLGLYCLVPFEAPAPPWFAVGDHKPSRPDRLHFSAAASSPAAGAGLSEEEREAAWLRMLARLRADPGFPLSLPETRLLLRRHAESHRAFRFADPAPGPEALLGDNPAAFYVTGDLDLAAAGPGVVWRSSDPAAITPEGRVSRPTDGRPRIVELEAAFPGGETRAYRLRVMPDAPGLPALFLSIGRPLGKAWRTDFACLRIPAGKDAEPDWLFGTGPGGGGAKLRGNTSFLKGRRLSMNLKFDEPAEMPGAETPVRHLLLLSGYADPSRLRNALSFDAFRDMSPDGVVRATAISWTEVFVNGAYAGVWECCPRLQDVLAEPFSDLYKVRSSHGLWTSPDDVVESVDRVDDRTMDAEAVDDGYAPLRDLMRRATAPDAAAFVRDAGDLLDIPELLDFFLLLNFTGNEDGRLTNQFIGRRETDGRWLLLPWDYDKTFLSGHAERRAAEKKPNPLTNPLFLRLFAHDPALRNRLAARWRELRAGPLSDARIDGWIDERTALLAPYMDEDYRVVPPFSDDADYAAAVNVLRREVHANAAWLDGYFAR